MGKKLTIAIALVAAAFNVHAQQQGANGIISNDAAKQQGGSIGATLNPGIYSTITGGSPGNIVPGYTVTAPQSQYFQGGQGQTVGLGTTRVTGCVSQNDPECQAVNLLRAGPETRPQFNITRQDPLLTKNKTLNATPSDVIGDITSTYETCRTETKTTPARFEDRVCNDYAGSETKTCTMGQVVVVDPDFNYQCTQSPKKIDTLTCNKTLVVAAVSVPSCSPGQFLTRVTANPCPACIDYLAFDFSCGNNNYLMHVFTILKSNGATYMDLGSQYVPGALDTYIPQTQGPSRVDGYYCYRTYYSQSCSGNYCTIGSWFYNPCQGTSYYGSQTFAMPTSVSFTDTWNDECTALDARTR